MMPRTSLSRRAFLLSGLVCGSAILPMTGCFGPAIRSQSPESKELQELETSIRLIGDATGPYGLNYIKVENAGLVTGLPNTGSDAPPSPQRAAIMADMLARGVSNPNQILASPTTSVVWVRAFIPPAAQVGDELDIEVRVPDQYETTDLSGGWLLETQMKEMVAIRSAVHTGHVMASGEGALLVGPLFDNDDKSKLLQGRVLSGGRVKKARPIGLVLREADKSVVLSKQIGDTLNKRFHTYNRGSVRGIANPKSDSYIELVLHPRYKHNIPRYIQVINSVAIYENPSQRLSRLRLLESQLLDPVTTNTAALRLEAIGKDGIPTLKKGLESKNLEVRFYSAEALAYLDDSNAIPVLAEAARVEPAFRIYAFTALSTMEELSAGDELKALFDSQSAETRYGAFRAMWGMNKNDPAIAGQNLGGKLYLHSVSSRAPAMVHVSRTFRPEVVLFGGPQQLLGPMTIEAGKSIVVKINDDQKVTISRFVVGEADKKIEVDHELANVIRGVIEIGGHYPDVVHMLHEADRLKTLTSRFEIDCLPQVGRKIARDRNSKESDMSDLRSTLMPNLFGQSTDDASTEELPPPDEKTEEKAEK
jgi:hypothetical protein